MTPSHRCLRPLSLNPVLHSSATSCSGSTATPHPSPRSSVTLTSCCMLSGTQTLLCRAVQRQRASLSKTHGFISLKSPRLCQTEQLVVVGGGEQPVSVERVEGGQPNLFQQSSYLEQDIVRVGSPSAWGYFHPLSPPG